MNRQQINLIFKAVGLAMGVATLILSVLDSIEVEVAITFLSIGIASLGIGQLNSEHK